MAKAWTVSRGPIAASATDLQKAEAINRLLVRTVGILPMVPGDPIRPFAIGLWDEMRRMMRPGVELVSLRHATSAFTHSKRYLFACAQPDAMRHDLEGHPIEPVSEEHRLAAQMRFLGLKSRTPRAHDVGRQRDMFKQAAEQHAAS